MPNDNIMGIPTKACINGLTKEDTERLKNALIKKIVNDDTVIDITDDGKIIVVDGDGLYLSFDGNILGLIKDSSGDYIPQTVPYLPEDENENPLAPPNDTIMTSANIAVDPRLVHITGTELITGIKYLKNRITCYGLIEHASDIDYMATSFRNETKIFDKKDGQYSLMAHNFYYKGGSTSDNEYVSVATRIYKVDRQSFEGFEFRSYNNGIVPLITTPIYPTDANNNPIAITNNALECSGQIAVDPRLVHTTNKNENIDGIKTFLKPIVLGSSNVSIGAKTESDVTTVYLSIDGHEKVIATYQNGVWN